MQAKTFRNKTAVDVDVRYYLAHVGREGYLNRLSEREAGNILRMLKREPEAADTFKVVREVITRVANACYYCGARPRTWEWDCDGQFENVTCDSEQCRTGRFGE
jgi:hypothetical protein